MKTLRIALIVLVLAASVRAGDMGNGSPSAAPTPTPHTPTAIQTIDETPTGESGDVFTDEATEVALNLLQFILALI